MSALTGTEKQIAWAKKIRASALESVTPQGFMGDVAAAMRDGTGADLLAQFGTDQAANLQRLSDLADTTRAFLAEQAVAAWWINHRPQGTELDGPARWWRIATQEN